MSVLRAIGDILGDQDGSWMLTKLQLMPEKPLYFHFLTFNALIYI